MSAPINTECAACTASKVSTSRSNAAIRCSEFMGVPAVAGVVEEPESCHGMGRPPVVTGA